MIKFLKFWVLPLLVCLVSLTESISQNLSQHNWYFGNSNRAIRFDRVTDSAMLVNNQALPFGTGGSAVATNLTNGDLLFYTDGVRVYNSMHLVMPGGLLNANTNLNQPVAICPVPGQPTQYYVFTNDGTGTIFRSTVDLSLVGNEPAPTPPLGDVVTGSTTAMGLTSQSQAMMIVPQGSNYWLITHEANSIDYNATLINGPGPYTTVMSTITTSFPLTAANFSYHPPTGRLAVSPLSADDNVVILNFDTISGQLTPFVGLTNSAVPNSAVNSTIGQSIYDTEWSASGRYLYISRHGEAGIPADIVQFDFSNITASLTSVLDFVPNRSYGLQMAPDSAIYYLYQATAGGPFLVGRLTNTDTAAIAVNDSASYFGAAVNFNGTQFPSFNNQTEINLTVTFTTAGTCSNSPISFYPLVSPTADSVQWDFGDSQTSNEWSPIHTYISGGPPSYNVTVTAFLNGQTASATLPLTIRDFDVQIQMTTDTTACECELPVNNGVIPCPNDTSDDFELTADVTGGTGTLSYIWSNGDVGPILTPDSAGYYYIVVTDSNVPGCTAYAGVNIREYDAVDQRANVWYFGDGGFIDFNQPPQKTSGPLNTPEGTSVISDRNGFVVLSTDGVNVYNRKDELLLDGVGAPITIGGENGATQSALIIPVPGDETLYYIFTTQQVQGSYTYELRYSLYDITLDGGDGGLIQYNQLLFTRSTERLTGNANWLIAHEYGNNSFRAYRITPQGIENPVISSIGSDHVISEEMNGQGYMKLGGQLVVALANEGVSNFLEFFDFDNLTGEITNFRSVNLNSAAGQVYGIEFSGNKVLATLRGVPSSFLREVFVDSLGNATLVPPGPASGPIAAELGAIQIGPDGTLYVAENNTGTLGTISVNPDPLLLSNYNLHGYALQGGGQSRLGLPNFIQNVGTAPQNASILVLGLCFGDSTIFTGGGTDPIDEFEWFFGDGFGATTQMATHLYAAPGTYTVSLRVTNRCGLDTLLTQQITIVAPPAPPNFLPPGQLPVLCNGPLTLEAEPAPGTVGYTYLWNTGSTNRTISVSQPSRVSVTITNAQGCTSFGTTAVVENRPQLDFGPDQTICQNTPAGPLDALNPGLGMIYTWYINDIDVLNNTRTQTVNTSAPTPPTGVEYRVEIEDPITSCVGTDSIVFFINASPTFTTVPTNPTACGLSNGQIAMNIVGPAGSLFSYSYTGITPPANAGSGIDQPTGPINFTGLKGDTYVIQVTDQVSTCTTVSTVGLNNNTFTISSITRQNACDPVNLVVSHNVVGAFTYNVIDDATGINLTPGGVSVPGGGSPLIVPNILSGSYTVQITAGTCSSSLSATVAQDPEATITGFTMDGCSDPITVGVVGGDGWTWTAVTPVTTNITSLNTLQTITAEPTTQGNHVFNVRVTQAGFCPLDTAVTVPVSNTIVVDFELPDVCQDAASLIAEVTPAGGTYTYRWYRDNVYVPGVGQSFPITIADNPADYRVEASSTVSVCIPSSATKSFDLVGDLEVEIPIFPPCSPFDLNANVTLSGVTQTAGVTYQWQFNGDDISGATSSILANQTREGDYNVIVNFSGCEANAGGPINIDDAQGSLPERAIICDGQANPDCREPGPNSCYLLLDPDPTNRHKFKNHVWTPAGTVPPGPTYYPVTTIGTYVVQMESTQGCIVIDQTIVERECNPRIVAPTAFRPGSSIDKNSEFSVLTFFVADQDFQIFIYNRWGEMVYQASGLETNDESTLQSKGWNGGYNNNRNALLPAGTYSYVVKYRTQYGNKSEEKRGGVVLLR